MRVLHITSELAPWSGTGGLADVAASLPDAQQAAFPGWNVAVASPLYASTRRLVHELSPVVPGVAEVVRPTGARQFFVEAPELFEREGIYDDPRGWVHGDNPLRFATLCTRALDAASVLLGGAPDVVHAHDWPTAIGLWYARHRTGERLVAARLILTIHNIGYQGTFHKSWVPALGLDWRGFVPECFEHHDELSFLKAGIASADWIVAPSVRHAEEIRTAEGGHGLDGFLRVRSPRVRGILNGIDDELWDPAHDPYIAAPFSADLKQGKQRCRAALAEELAVDVGAATPIVGIVSRLVWQKGLDLLASIVPRIVDAGAVVALVGTGERDLEQQWQALAERLPGRVAVRIAFDSALAHRLQAGADMLAIPSRYEPCGLTQMYAMRYGAVPVARAVGGLADTVIDADATASFARGGASTGADPSPTGFVFSAFDADDALDAFVRAIRCFRDEPARWAQLVDNGMRRDFSWGPSARAYADLYQTPPPA